MLQTPVTPNQVHKICAFRWHRMSQIYSVELLNCKQVCSRWPTLVTILKYWKGDHRQEGVLWTLLPPQIWSQSWSHRQRRDLLCVFLLGGLLTCEQLLLLLFLYITDGENSLILQFMNILKGILRGVIWNNVQMDFDLLDFLHLYQYRLLYTISRTTSSHFTWEQAVTYCARIN